MVGFVPYSLGLYRIEYHGEIHGNVDLEDMEVINANDGNTAIQTRIVMRVKEVLGIKRWVEFSELTLERLGESSTPSGCDCECYACDEMGRHCSRRGKGCYI